MRLRDYLARSRRAYRERAIAKEQLATARHVAAILQAIHSPDLPVVPIEEHLAELGPAQPLPMPEWLGDTWNDDR